MSEDYTKDHPFPSGLPYGTQGQGAASELQSILDRVKDERLRMLRLLKDCETRFGTAGVVPPAEEIARLTGKVRAIDDAVRNRYDQLRHDETLLEKRAYQVDQIREGVQELAEQLNKQISQARTFKPELSAAKMAVNEAMEQIVAEARSQLNLLGDNVAERIAEYRNTQATGQEQLRDTRRDIEKVFNDIDGRLAAAAGMARDEAQKLIDPIFGQLENHTTDCGQRIQRIIEAADDTVREKIESLPAQAQKALEPARETLNAVISDAREQITAVNDALRSLDDRLNGLSDQAEGIIEQQLDSISSRAGQALDGLVEKRLTESQAALDQQQDLLTQRLREQDEQLTKRFEEQQKAFEIQHKTLTDRLREQDEKYAQRAEQQQQAFEQRERELGEKLKDILLQKQAEMIVALDEQAAGLIDRSLTNQTEKIEQSITESIAKASDQAAERINTVINDAESRAHDMAQQLHGQLTASLDQSHAEALEANRKIEIESETIAEKADGKAAEVARAIERSMREHVVEAMSRADAITDPFKARLEDALSSHRELADEYSKIAEVELTDKAKAHWDAFRHETQAALEKQKQVLEAQAQDTINTTQQNMKQRVQDLCASSQSMVDLIEQQLTRKLKGVEPQAQQAMDIIEKQTGERLSQLRENAQSMVNLIEDQLAKRVAQLQPKAVNAARDAEHELNEHMVRVRHEIENTLAPLRRQAIEELGQIAAVGKSLHNAARRDIPHEAGSTEPPVVDASKLSTPLTEMASRMGKKAAKLVNARNENEPIPGQDTPAEQDNDDRQAA